MPAEPVYTPAYVLSFLSKVCKAPSRLLRPAFNPEALGDKWQIFMSELSESQRAGCGWVLDFTMRAMTTYLEQSPGDAHNAKYYNTFVVPVLLRCVKLDPQKTKAHLQRYETSQVGIYLALERYFADVLLVHGEQAILDVIEEYRNA